MTTESDLSALLQQGTREFAKLYERHAYRVYNLALRITCAREPAIRAAQEAFLTQTAGAGAEGDLLTATAKFAIRETAGDVAPGGAGGAEAEALLRATARLSGAERAALALSNLTAAGAEDLAQVLELTPEAAEAVLTRAQEGLASALSISPEDARESYDAWLMAEPPQELWTEMYPRFYTQLEREARKSAGVRMGAAERTRRAAGGAMTKAAARRDRRRAKRAERGGRRMLRPRTGFALALVGLAIFGGLQFTGVGGGDDSEFAALAEGEIPGVDESDAEDVARSDGDPYDPLTPKELDKLRLEELRDLRAQGEKEQARELSKRRKQAREEAAQARRARARERRRAILERKRAERERKLAERQHRAAARREAASRNRTPSSNAGGEEGGSELEVTIEEHRSDQEDGGSGGPSPDEARDSCLYDEESGTYVCPDE